MMWEYCKIEWSAERIPESRKVMLEAAAPGDWQFHPQGEGHWLAMYGTYMRLAPTSEQAPERIIQLHATIAQLGLEEWELVSRTERDNGAKFKEVLYFKRPLLHSDSS